MLKIIIPAQELFDSDKNEFHLIDKQQVLVLEHSLLSISKWESKWHKPFFGTKDKTNIELIDYIKCMTLNQGIDDYAYYALNPNDIAQINMYIEDPMTACWFPKEETKANREIITSDLIYYWMVALNIPFDPCQKWHINRLLTLVRVCNVKNAPAKKMNRRQVMNQNRELNRARRSMNHSTG